MLMYNNAMRLLILFLFVFLSACSTVKQNEGPQVDPEKTARQLITAGDYTAAADEYLALAEQNQTNSELYQLKATAAYVEAGEFDQAKRILSGIEVDEDNDLQQLRRRLLSARLELEFDQPRKATNLLNEISVDTIPDGLRGTYHDILSRAYLAHGEYLNAANERLKEKSYISTVRQEETFYRGLWEIFAAIPEADIDELARVAPESLHSWFELASIYQLYRFQPDKLGYAIDSWNQRFPAHPAFALIVPELLESSSRFVERPNKIALLMPFSNQFSKAANAIRDGFIAAWYTENNANDNNEIVMYDANSLNIIEKYQQAVADGAEYVVGPLEKEAIEQLQQFGELPIPILALNRPDKQNESGNDKIIQFGLLPEDEAKQVAELAISDGHALALVITPDNEWGSRIANSFIERWEELGGSVLEQVYLDTASKDFATPVKESLNVDSSQARATDLRSRLRRKIISIERRRQDMELIFVAAVPSDARQLMPQIRFFRAGDVPVYTTSHVFSGVEDIQRDVDMNNILFVDMPWILDTTRQLSLIQDSLNRNWSQDRSNYRRLYALGIDAYRLIPELNRLRLDKSMTLSGETGDLKLTDDNIIHRKLRRAQFVEGKPVLLN